MQFQTESYGTQAASGASLGGLQYRNYPDAPPTANGRVTDAVQSIARVADSLQQEVSLLEQRISGVLRPAVPTGSANAGKANTTPSEMAAALEALHERLYGVLGYLQSVTARVDI